MVLDFQVNFLLEFSAVMCCALVNILEKLVLFFCLINVAVDVFVMAFVDDSRLSYTCVTSSKWIKQRSKMSMHSRKTNKQTKSTQSGNSSGHSRIATCK